MGFIEGSISGYFHFVEDPIDPFIRLLLYARAAIARLVNDSWQAREQNTTSSWTQQETPIHSHSRVAVQTSANTK